MNKVSIILTLVCFMWASQSCKKSRSDANPFFAEWSTEYGVPPFDKIKNEHYLPAFDSAMVAHLGEIDSIVASGDEPGFENVIVAYDNSGAMLEQVAGVFFTLASSDTNPEIQLVEEKVSPLLAAHSDKIMLNTELFGKVRNVYEKRASLGLDPLQLRLTEKTYDKFIRAGAALPAEDMAKLKAINEELAVAGVKFGSNLLAGSKGFEMELDSSQVASLPSGVKASAAAAAKNPGKYLFTLNKPSLIPFITYSDQRDLREKLYRGYLERCNDGGETDNKQLVNDMVRLRTEKAKLLDYQSYAAYVLDEQMAKTPANVYALLDELWTPALERAKDELAEMKEIKKTETGDDSFEPWDWWYYANKVRKAKYDLDEEAIRPYLSLENVRRGIFDLTNRLYGITFRPAISLPVYNKECQAYEVLDLDNKHLGVLYMDFFPRDGKAGGAWCETIRPQSYDENGERVAPVVTISCNFTRPTSKDSPALLDIDETETFFHEFGHAIHFLVADVPYKGLLDVERDFVELPSQIMENWATEPQLLRQYATHYRTNEVIPDHLIDKITRSRLFNQGFATTEYLAAAYSDMDLHNMNSYVPFDVNNFEQNALYTKRGMIKEIAPRYRYPYFKHIFDPGSGYEAGYYSYIWSEVLDQDAYAAFKASGDIFDKKLATAFRKELLEKGGSADGMTLYRNFRGAEPSRIPLLLNRGLIDPPQEPVEVEEVTEEVIAAS